MSHDGVISIADTPAGVLCATLSNFDVNSEELKPRHRTFLKEEVAPILRRDPNMLVRIVGAASRHGTTENNWILSRWRARAVQGFLYRALSVPERQFRVYWVGEAGANSPYEEYWADRAVVVEVFPQPPPPPPSRPQPPPPPVAQTNNTFKIKMLSELSGGLWGVVGFDRIVLQIWDETNRLICVYQYLGAGGTWGTPIGGTLEGPWDDFRTTQRLSVVEFGGSAGFSTLGAGGLSGNLLRMAGLPRGIRTVPDPVPVRTGVTLGGGTSATNGWLFSAPDMPQPFSGQWPPGRWMRPRHRWRQWHRGRRPTGQRLPVP